MIEYWRWEWPGNEANIIAVRFLTDWESDLTGICKGCGAFACLEVGGSVY